jgi:hypothetical protein
MFPFKQTLTQQHVTVIKRSMTQNKVIKIAQRSHQGDKIPQLQSDPTLCPTVSDSLRQFPDSFRQLPTQFGWWRLACVCSAATLCHPTVSDVFRQLPMFFRSFVCPTDVISSDSLPDGSNHQGHENAIQNRLNQFVGGAFSTFAHALRSPSAMVCERPTFAEDDGSLRAGRSCATDLQRHLKMERRLIAPNRKGQRKDQDNGQTTREPSLPFDRLTAGRHLRAMRVKSHVDLVTTNQVTQGTHGCHIDSRLQAPACHTPPTHLPACTNPLHEIWFQSLQKKHLVKKIEDRLASL